MIRADRIELPAVATHQKTQQGLKPQEPSRKLPAICHVATHQKTQQGLKHERDRGRRSGVLRRNASENPAGIETFEIPVPSVLTMVSQRIRKPSRD